MTRLLPAGSVLLDPADAALAALVLRDLAARQAAAGRPVPPRLTDLAAVLAAAANASPVVSVHTAVDQYERVGVAGGSRSARGRDTQARSRSPHHPNLQEVTVHQAAAMLGLSTSRIRQLIATGVLPARRPGARLLLVDHAAITAYAAERALQ